MLAAVQVSVSRGARGAVNLTFQGTDSSDFIHIDKDAKTGRVVISGPTAAELQGLPNNTTFQFNGHSVRSKLVFSKLGNLTFNLGAGEDSVRMTDVSAGNIKINDGVADNENNTYIFQGFSGKMKLGDIQANFNRGTASVVFGEADGDMELGKVSVQGTSNTHYISVSMIEYGSPGSMTVKGLLSIDLPENATGTTYLSMLCDNQGLKLLNGIRQSGGAGNDDSQINGNVQIQGNVDITTRGGNDTVSIEPGVVVNGIVTINTGSGQLP